MVLLEKKTYPDGTIKYFNYKDEEDKLGEILIKTIPPKKKPMKASAEVLLTEGGGPPPPPPPAAGAIRSGKRGRKSGATDRGRFQSPPPKMKVSFNLSDTQTSLAMRAMEMRNVKRALQLKKLQRDVYSRKGME